MSDRAVSRPDGVPQAKPGKSKGGRGKASRGRPGERPENPQPGSPTRLAPAKPTPVRPVVSVALVLFVPAVLLVMDGNLSVQTALVRFIGALLVSWVAARLVFATVSSFAGAVTPAEAVGPPVLAGVAGPALTLGLDEADAAGRPEGAG